MLLKVKERERETKFTGIRFHAVKHKGENNGSIDGFAEVQDYTGRVF
jgi:hypothetical protein